MLVILQETRITYHRGDSEVASVKLLGEPVHLPSGVAENDGLGDRQGLVQVAQGVELPLFALNTHVELANTLKGDLLLLDEDADGVAHEPSGDLKHILRHGGAQEDDLDLRVQLAENVVDLVLEATGEHLVGLVEDKHFDVVGLQNTARNHVKHAPRGACEQRKQN